jgi:hypothetical protein
MNIVLYVVSILWIAAGSFVVIDTRRARAFFGVVAHTKHTRVLAVIPCIIGLILIVGAFYYRSMFWLAFVLGLVGVSKAAFLLLSPVDRVKRVLSWWFEKAAEETLRLYGLIAFLFGTAIFSHLA